MSSAVAVFPWGRSSPMGLYRRLLTRFGIRRCCRRCCRCRLIRIPLFRSHRLCRPYPVNNEQFATQADHPDSAPTVGTMWNVCIRQISQKPSADGCPFTLPCASHGSARYPICASFFIDAPHDARHARQANFRPALCRSCSINTAHKVPKAHNLIPPARAASSIFALLSPLAL